MISCQASCFSLSAFINFQTWFLVFFFFILTSVSIISYISNIWIFATMDVCDFSKLLVWFFTNEKKWWTYKRIKILNHFSSETNTRELGGKFFPMFILFKLQVCSFIKTWFVVEAIVKPIWAP